MIFLLFMQQLLALTTSFAYAAVLPPIVGGKDANIEDYPYQVALERHEDNFQFCGGSILSERFIITAAHCVYEEEDVTNLQIRVGANCSSDGGEIFLIAKATIHPDFAEWSNDVAILELKRPLKFSKSVNKIDLSGGVELGGGTIVNITGYGVTKSRKKQRLQAVQVPIVSRKDCKEAYSNTLTPPVTEAMICAGVLGTGGKDSCQGDSGGPLAHEGKLYGIVSWGVGCADPEYPGVYSNVVYLLPFIKEVTGL